MIDSPNSSAAVAAARAARPERGAAPAAAPASEPASVPVVTVVEPEAFAPLGRLGEWLFAENLADRKSVV